MKFPQRTAKIVTGVVALSIGCAAILKDHKTVGDGESIINAKLVKLRAPSDGLVMLDNLPFGTPILKGDIVARVAIKDLVAESPLTAKLEQNALEDQIRTLERIAAKKEQETRQIQDNRIQGLKSKIIETEAAIALETEKENQHSIIFDRKNLLYQYGYTSLSSIVTAKYSKDEDHLHRAALLRQLAMFKSDLLAAQHGTFVGEGFDNVSYSQQRADEIAIRLSELKSALARKQAIQNIQNVGLRQDEDGEGGNRLLQPEMVKPLYSAVFGKIWKFSVNPGETVRAGDEMVDVLDCSSMFTTVQSAGHDLDTVQIGQKLVFVSEDSTEIAGTVAFASVSERDFDSILGAAIPLKAPAPVRMSLLISLEPNAEQLKSCPVGLRGRIVFASLGTGLDRFVPSFLRNVIAALEGVRPNFDKSKSNTIYKTAAN